MCNFRLLSRVSPWRESCSSQPQARIPVSPAHRTYDIGYFHRDVRRSAMPGDSAIEDSFAPSVRHLLEGPALIAAPKEGSPGNKNPDVERYDPSGLRTVMTVTHAATRRSLAQHRAAAHLPLPKWEYDTAGTAEWARTALGADKLIGRPEIKRVQSWGYTRTNDW